MISFETRVRASLLLLSGLLFAWLPGAYAADQALLDVLLENGAISQEQYDALMEKESLTADDIITAPPAAEGETSSTTSTRTASAGFDIGDADVAAETDTHIEIAVADAVAAKFEEDFPVKSSYGSNGFRLETRDGDWQTNLQWRAQMRYSNPYVGDPRQIEDFAATGSSNFEARRLRMKIGGHGFKPWLKYYFEVDLQPSRDADSSAVSSSARVIDWRIDLAKWDFGGLRVGQWKIDMNRERVDSSGRQQFVERSIVNRIFTIDRQIGIQWRGHAFKNTPADLRYYIGVFNGEGRGVRNVSEKMMYSGRVQWNFMGRDLPLRQSDVEYTDKPTGSLAFGGATTEGPCTRWSSSGCGSLDGFASPVVADGNQFEIEQVVQDFVFKYRGLSIQQEYHRKFVTDRVVGSKNDLTGAFFQTGYFFSNIFPSVPAPLELAMRYAYVEEPNEIDRMIDNEREEFTLAANWFFAGHNNKLTLDYSHLTLDDRLLGIDENGDRVRLQWDVSF